MVEYTVKCRLTVCQLQKSAVATSYAKQGSPVPSLATSYVKHGSHLLCQTVKYRVSGLGSGTRWTSGRVGLPVPTRLSFENHRVAGNSKYRGQTVSSGYPNPTRYPVFHLLPDPTRFSFENHRVAGNPKYRVLPEISGKPGVSGITRYIG